MSSCICDIWPEQHHVFGVYPAVWHRPFFLPFPFLPHCPNPRHPETKHIKLNFNINLKKQINTNNIEKIPNELHMFHHTLTTWWWML